MHESCVTQVPNDATVELDGSVTLNGRRVRPPVPCAYPALNRYGQAMPPTVPVSQSPTAWVAASWQQWGPLNVSNSREFTRLDSGTFRVPNDPTNRSGVVLYFFPSLQGQTIDGSRGVIVQPVLQWGHTPFFPSSGFSWTYTPWIYDDATPNKGFSTFQLHVREDDQLYGQMILKQVDSAGNRLWQVLAQNLSNGEWSRFNRWLPAIQLRVANSAALEIANFNQCEDLPSNGLIEFGAPRLFTGAAGTTQQVTSTGTWGSCPTNCHPPDGSVCHFGNLVESTGATTLLFWH